MTPLTPLQPWTAHKIGCASEAITRNKIEAYQVQKLQETLDWCRAQSPAYRRRLDGLPQTLSTLDDWRVFPFTTPDEVRDKPLAFLCVSQSDIARVVTLESSGTSGPPKRLYFTAEDQELTRDFFHIGMSTFTTPGDRVLILLPGERPGSVGDLLAQALARLGATGIKHGLVTDVARTLAVIQAEQVTGVVGVPVQVLGLARAAAAQSLPRPYLKSVLLTMDHVPQAIVRAVETAWGCTVYNHYGMTEMGLGGGVECAARQGYHLREADLYVEIVDPITSEPVPDGEMGEIVFTTLTRRGMPLLRYRTGDISRFLVGECGCGTVLRRLEKVRWRWQGRFPLPNGHFLTLADLDEALFAVEGVLDFAAAISPTTLHLTVQSETVGIEPALRQASNALATGVGISLSVQPQKVGQGGKRQFSYR